MRKLLDAGNTDLTAVLERLLLEDVDITAREVARRHPTLRNASAFTRNASRAVLIRGAMQRQADARQVKDGGVASRARTLSDALEEQNGRVVELETRVNALVSAVVLCIRAVRLSGGAASLERLWTTYKEVGDALREEGVVPPSARVLQLPPPGRSSS